MAAPSQTTRHGQDPEGGGSPHPLIAHWLTVLRHAGTPPALYATGMEELGRWLSYEAVRDWLPHRRESVSTPCRTPKVM